MPGVYDKLEQSLKEISREISVTPTAILAVSGIGKARTHSNDECGAADAVRLLRIS